MSDGGAPDRPARFVHVVNFGAFSDFGKLCRSMAMDLYPAASRVFLHDIDVPEKRPAAEGVAAADAGREGAGPGLMEPWLRRFENFETFLERLVETINRNQLQHHAEHQDERTSHSVVLCVAPEELAKAAATVAPAAGPDPAAHPVSRPAPLATSGPRPSVFDRGKDVFVRGSAAGSRVTAPPTDPAEDPDTTFAPDTIPAILRHAVRRLNRPESPDTSVVVFCGMASADRRRGGTAATMARLLWNAPDEGTVHHSRNGVIGITADGDPRSLFLAMRALVDIMHSNRWNSLRMTSQRLLGLTQDLSRVSLLHLDAEPEQITADVIAKVLEAELGANRTLTDTAEDDREQLAQLNDFVEHTRTAIERLVPLGQNDLPGKDASADGGGAAVEARQSRAQAETEGDSRAEGGANGAAHRRHTALQQADLPEVPQLVLPSVDLAIRRAFYPDDEVGRYLRGLADWHAKALRKLMLNYAAFAEIDLATERFETRPLPADSNLTKAFEAERAKFRQAISDHLAEAEACRAWVVDRSNSMGADTVTAEEAQLPNLPALAQFLGREKAYREAVRRTPRRLWPLWHALWVVFFLSVIIVFSLVYQAQVGGYGWADLNLRAFWTAEGEDAPVFWSRMFFLVLGPLALGIGGLAAAAARSGLADRRRALIAAAEDLSLAIERLPVAEFAARRHGVAAQRLTAALARLDTCKPDRGDRFAASEFHPYRQFVIADGSWQADVQRKLSKAYADSMTERSLKERVKTTLKNAALFSGTPPVATFGGPMTCAAGGFEDTWQIVHSLGQSPVRTRWVPVAASEARA